MPASPCLIVILIAAFAASLALAAAVCAPSGIGYYYAIGCKRDHNIIPHAVIDCDDPANNDIHALDVIVDIKYPSACGRWSGASVQLKGNCTSDVLKYAHTCETGVYRGPMWYLGPATITGQINKWRLDNVAFRDIEFNLAGQPFGRNNFKRVEMSKCTFTGLD